MYAVLDGQEADKLRVNDTAPLFTFCKLWRPFRMYVGQRLDGAHHFDGSMDEVRIYKRALTSTEINSIRTTNSTTVPNAVLDLPLG
jgi:hypothetical protein